MTKNAAKRVDVNTATLDELSSVPGLGPALASRVIDSRPYAKLEDLTIVKGIGPKSLEPLLPFLTAELKTKQEKPELVEAELPESKPKIIIPPAADEEKSPFPTSLSISTLLPVFVILGITAILMILLRFLAPEKEKAE